MSNHERIHRMVMEHLAWARARGWSIGDCLIAIGYQGERPVACWDDVYAVYSGEMLALRGG